MKPSRWIAIYRGKVRAPKSGTFRFVGAGDDVIAVRFNNQNVFDYGWFQASLGKMTAAQDMKWINAMQNKPGNDALKKELRDAGINVPPSTFYKYSTTSTGMTPWAAWSPGRRSPSSREMSIPLKS